MTYGGATYSPIALQHVNRCINDHLLPVSDCLYLRMAIQLLSLHRLQYQMVR